MDTTGIEVKSADEAGVNLAFDTFMRGFEVYKEENEERLKQLEKRGTADPLTTDKLARLDRMFDDLAHKTARPQLAGLSTKKSPATAVMMPQVSVMP